MIQIGYGLLWTAIFIIVLNGIVIPDSVWFGIGVLATVVLGLYLYTNYQLSGGEYTTVINDEEYELLPSWDGVWLSLVTIAITAFQLIYGLENLV